MTDVSRTTLLDEWERQRDEPSKAFNAFVIFREMGDERSVTKVRDEAGFAASHRQLLNWAEKHRWIERVDAYERYLDRRRVKAQADEVERQARRQIEVGQVLQDVGLRYINENLQNEEDRRKNLTTNGSLRFVSRGVELEREGLGLNDKGGAGDTNVQINVMDAGTKDTLFGQIRTMAVNIHAVRQLAIGPKVTNEVEAPEEEIIEAEVIEDPLPDE
jgi:hypothetical protein